ncbi:hypothetical protein SSS_10529, partial [Sarcoptes scabiei]
INSHFCYIDHRTDRVEAKRIKMLRQLLLLCLVAIVIDQALIVSAKSKNLKHPHHPHCPPHSHWDPCSPGCEHSCATLDKDLVCTKECGPGCACDDDVHWYANLDANAIKTMCDETAMALVRVSAEDIANDLTTENALNILIGLLVVFHARKHVHILMVH